MATPSSSSEPRTVRLAAFGKHPGWDDHIDDIGLDTTALVTFKRLLYFEGLAANIDAGRWQQMSDSQRLTGFAHAFVQVAGGSVIVGRMWASRDGKNRARYPMIVCAQCEGTGIAWALGSVLPRLAPVETACREAATAAAVFEILAEASRDCGAALAQAGDCLTAAPAGLDSPAALAGAAAAVEPKDGALGFKRWLYKVERDLVVYRPDPGRKNGPASERLPQHVRLPAGGEAVERVLFLTLAMTLRVLRPSTPLFVVAPVGQPWVDVLVGEPRAQQFACLLATPEHTPPITGIPYTLDAAFDEHAEKFLADWRADPVSVADFLAAPFAVADPAAGAAGWWRRVTSALKRDGGA